MPDEVKYEGPRCEWCGEPMHRGYCFRVRRVEFFTDPRTKERTMKAVELYAPHRRKWDAMPAYIRTRKIEAALKEWHRCSTLIGPPETADKLRHYLEAILRAADGQNDPEKETPDGE